MLCVITIISWVCVSSTATLHVLALLGTPAWGGRRRRRERTQRPEHGFSGFCPHEPLGGTEGETAGWRRQVPIIVSFLIEPQKKELGGERFPFKEGYCFLVKKTSPFRANIVFGSCFSEVCNTGMKSLTYGKLGTISVVNMCRKRHECQSSDCIPCLGFFDAWHLKLLLVLWQVSCDGQWWFSLQIKRNLYVQCKALFIQLLHMLDDDWCTSRN